MSIILMSLSLFLLQSATENSQKQERLDLMNQIIQFQANAEISIQESIYLLEGYMAYVETNPQLTDRESEAFLGYLLKNKKTLIRNIGVLQNTTIIWNYPQEGNEESIGVDLTEIDDQKVDVLLVKENGESTFRGPVKLLQGGLGFIARLPLSRFGEYWGQISIVMDADQYKTNLEQIAKEAGLNIAVYNAEQFPTNPFYGDPAIYERNSLLLNFNILNSHWLVAAEPIDGWQSSIPFFKEMRLIFMIISLMIGLMVFIIMHTRHQLKYQALTDPLTHLGNRHALNMQMDKISNATKQLPVTVFMFDINSFKQINDRYGHDVGDQVLVTFADQLNQLPCKQKKVYRLGGDEFLVILIESLKNCKLSLDTTSIRELLSFTLETIHPPTQIVPSIGIVQLPDEENSLKKAIEMADRRMYEDKDAMRIETK
ncbi:diguanylate cyclase [Gottschalkiaceae bacterium SANA]|nr:diguanylate cyclase [Gottschalkiaceae bacterium SANA]